MTDLKTHYFVAEPGRRSRSRPANDYLGTRTKDQALAAAQDHAVAKRGAVVLIGVTATTGFAAADLYIAGGGVELYRVTPHISFTVEEVSRA